MRLTVTGGQNEGPVNAIPTVNEAVDIPVVQSVVWYGHLGKTAHQVTSKKIAMKATGWVLRTNVGTIIMQLNKSYSGQTPLSRSDR